MARRCCRRVSARAHLGQEVTLQFTSFELMVTRSQHTLQKRICGMHEVLISCGQYGGRNDGDLRDLTQHKLFAPALQHSLAGERPLGCEAAE